MTTTIETRSIRGVEIRADAGKPPRLVGYAAIFNSRSLPLGQRGSQFVEIIRPGAYKRSLAAGADVRAFVDHETSLIIGRRKAGTCILREDERGLRVEIEPPDTQTGRDVMTNIRVGNLDGMSFAFDPELTADRWDFSANPPLRELLDIELLDVSVVSFPAYQKTEVGVRSMTKALGAHELAQARQRRLEQIEAEVRRGA